jgi:hypothetical protein
MPKALTTSGLVVSGLLLLVFGADLATKLPFHRASMWMDIAFVIGSAILGYMSWSAMRDLR